MVHKQQKIELCENISDIFSGRDLVQKKARVRTQEGGLPLSPRSPDSVAVHHPDLLGHHGPGEVAQVPDPLPDGRFRCRGLDSGSRHFQEQEDDQRAAQDLARKTGRVFAELDKLEDEKLSDAGQSHRLNLGADIIKRFCLGQYSNGDLEGSSLGTYIDNTKTK